jgi:phosphoribosylamine--glycine ligase
MTERDRGNVVLVVDGGGRGSALVDKYSQSERVDRVIVVPGNDLMKINTDKPVETYPQLQTTSTREILEICDRDGVTLADVAQDRAVEAGLVDALTNNGVPVVGPTKRAGRIEWDKAWARIIGERYSLPQPVFKICLSAEDGFSFIDSQPSQPWFVKAAFLAEGKGAFPARNSEEARKRIIQVKELGEAGEMFLVEEWLAGDDGFFEEFSTFVFSDGEHYQIIGSAQDHKRAGNFDEGENTGGMGCSSPPLVLTQELMEIVSTKIVDKIIKGLQKEARPYKGVLYLGGMLIRERGSLRPYVIEFNARWGDPEAQVILPGITNDLFEVSMAIAHGDISDLKIQTDGKVRVAVVGASKGYPGNYKNVIGKQIYGLDNVNKIDGVRLYGAGVQNIDGRHYANGGRLFHIVGEGETIIEARRKAYEAMAVVSVEGNNLHFRTDIGWRDVQRLQERRYVS